MGKRKRCTSLRENNENSSQLSITEESVSKTTDEIAKRKKTKEETGGNLKRSNAKDELTDICVEIEGVNNVNKTCPEQNAILSTMCPPASPPATCAVPQTSSPPQTRNTLQLRTSARVLNKQRREETKRDEALSNVIQDLTEKDLETDNQENEKSEGTGGRKKRRRAWELWSMEDKNLFFEAINDCGKDFEAIQNYLTTKMRKKGNAGYTIKNKDQVRHFYYRTWHKISKYITFNEGVKKATQELYGLINFGELRKKSGGQLDEKKGLKLQELIHKGSTTVRIRGKGIRVRTPICRALKKLNQIVEKRDATVQKVPSSVTVELVPGNMAAWCHVQGQAHNPRLRFNSSLQRPLHTLLQHVQEKWRKSHLKLRETLSHRATFPIELPPVKEQVLRLLPPKGVTIKPCSIEADMFLKSSEVSLISHERQLSRCNEKKGGRKKSGKKQQKNSNTASIGSTENLSEVMDVGSADGYQEELDDCSDVEDPLGVPSPEDEVVFSPEQPNHFINVQNKVKLEKDDLSMSPPQKLSNEDLDADVRVKEESDAESGDVLRQLLALERVAGAQDDHDSEVQYIGESTRLTSQNLEASGRGAIGEEPEAATTPEPPEEDDLDEDGISHYQSQAEIDVEAQLSRIRAGWTLECASNITIGELYLMFGQNKKLTLEYEFGDLNSKKEECLKSPRTPSSNMFESPVRPSNNANEQIIENSDLGQELENSNEAITNFDNSNQTSNEEVNIGETNIDCHKNVSIDKKEAVENLSGMLQQLLGMARTIFSKPGGLYELPCPCGHVCPQGSGGPISGLRSPAGSRCQNLFNGVGRSPCSTRSPRNSRLIVDGFLSPKASLSEYRGRSPLTTKQKRDTRKPASAKKLIPDMPDTQTHQTRERLKSISGSDIITDLIDGPMRNQVSADMRIHDLADSQPQLVNSSNPQERLLNINSIGSMSTITASSIDNKLVNTTSLDTLPGSRGQISTVTSQASTIGQSQVPAVIGTTPVSIAGMSIVVGNDHAGEFRIPTAPAPRQMHTQASFNAQLNKLLPRYNKRPGRRIMRNKNIVIQRQLPLLPKVPPRPPSLVTLNVLAQGGQGGSGNFVPISPLSTSSNPRGPNIQRMPHPSNVPQNMMNIRQVIPGMQMVQQLHAGQKVLQVTGPVAHTVQTAGTASHAVQTTGGQQLPIIRSAATPQQQTIVSGQTTGSSVIVTSTQADLSSGNSISINVSGQPMLTMRMPTNTSASTSIVQDVASAIQTSGATRSNDIIVNNTENSSTISDPHINSSSMNGILKDIVSEALNELPDLSTPPGTPRPSSSCSTPMNTPNHKAAGHPGSHHDLTISPSSLFNTSFTLESGTPSLYGNLPDNNTSSSAADASTTSFNQLTSSPVSILSSSNRRYLSELSPPHASPTNELASLLNTPTPHQASNSTINTPRRETSPPLHNTSLSALLSSASPDLAKGFPLILGESNSQHQDFTDSSQPSSSVMPELHLSDSVNLPLLDISIGGTVSINDDPQNMHSEKSSADPNILSSVASNNNVPTSTASIMQMEAMRETNTEKLLDITLGISNSNSSFSSLLAAATQPREEDGMMDSSFLQHSSMNSSVVGFPGLSGTNHPSPPSSPSRLLQHEDENHWLNNEVNDYSLSSLLGHFDSPAKGGSSKTNSSQSSSTIVSGNGLNNSVHQENTVDFTSKFAEMKEQVARNLNK